MAFRRIGYSLVVPALLIGLGGLGGCAQRSMRDSIKSMNDGIEFFNRGQNDRAEEALKQATGHAIENHQAWYTLGLVYSKEDKTEKALEAFSKAVQYKDDDPMYHLALGEAHLREKTPNISQAQTHLERAVELEPRLYRGHFLLGRVYDQKGDAKAAAERWTKAAAGSPTTFGKPFNSLGMLYIRWDFLDQAVAVLRAGLTRVTDRDELSDLNYHLGLALAGQNKHQEAVDAYTKSLDQRKGNLDALRQRGYAFLALGDKEKAKADLEGFVKARGGEKTRGGSDFEVQTINQTLFRLAVEK